MEALQRASLSLIDSSVAFVYTYGPLTSNFEMKEKKTTLELLVISEKIAVRVQARQSEIKVCVKTKTNPVKRKVVNEARKF